MKKFPILSFFGLTKELLQMQSYIRINDNTSAVVENVKRIDECSEVCVRLITDGFELEIWGSSLVLSSFTESSVGIRGIIDQVRLVSRKVRDAG